MKYLLLTTILLTGCIFSHFDEKGTTHITKIDPFENCHASDTSDLVIDCPIDSSGTPTHGEL